MTDELKPCPFCGSNDLYVIPIRFEYDTPSMSAGDYTVGIFCNACKQTVILEENEIEGFTDKTIARAKKAWNRRAQ